MDTRIAQWLSNNMSNFDPGDLALIRSRIDKVDDERRNMIMSSSLKSPGVALLLSLFFGFLGVDRFYIGDVGVGTMKLLSCGLCCMFWPIDWCLIMSAARRVNGEAVKPYLN